MNRHRTYTAAWIMMSLALLPECWGAVSKIEVFVPCGMLGPFLKVRKQYEKAKGQPGCVTVVTENAVALMKRIRRGDRPDVLWTPGVVEMDLMVKEGYIRREDVRTFGSFKLIVVVPKENKARIKSVTDLTDKRVRRVAMAEPSENSVGYYAEEALKKLGLWNAVRPKLLKHWHALTAVTYVCKGRVDAGIYFDACPFESTPSELGENADRYRVAASIPEKAYPKVKVQAARLKKAPHPKGGQEFVEYLLTPQAQKILAANGLPNYEAPPKPNAPAR